MKIEDEITDLTEQWYNLIGGEHHKDRDCHWWIETMWSYGKPPVYVVSHNGYILDYVNDEFDSYSEALESLVYTLKTAISNEKERSKSNNW
jgi:hypothetical protein